MGEGNVVSMADHREEFPPPAHFRKVQIATWEELVRATPPTLHVPAMRFGFEFAATLLARFRSGKVMTVAENKQLQRYMAQLGLALDEELAKKPRKNDHYFDP